MFAEPGIPVQRRSGVSIKRRSMQRLRLIALFAERPTATTGKRNYEQ
jgi:hypothetical protein